MPGINKIITKSVTGTAKPFKSIPGPKGIYNLPIVGTALLLYPFSDIKLKKIHLLFRRLHERFGKIVRLRGELKDKVFLFDPDFIAHAMQHEGRYPHRITLPMIEVYARRTGKKPLSLYHCEDWQKIRSTLQHKLKPSVIAEYMTQQESCANDLIEWIYKNSDNSPDLKLAITHFLADANSVVLFNKKLGLVQNGQLSKNSEHINFVKDVNTSFETVAKSLYTVSLFRLFRTQMYQQYETSMNNVLKFCEDRIEEQLKTDRDTFTEDNILNGLINDDSLHRDMLPYALSLFMYAGLPTTTNAILWLLYCIAAFPEKQKILYDEINTKCPGPITSTALNHMPYLKACLKESFRCVFPTVNGSARTMPDDVEIGGYHIPKGTLVNFCHNTLSRSGEYFEQPDDFLPERWLPGHNSAEKQRLMSICCLPFGFGKRNCIGRRLAEQEIYISVIKILQNFSLSLDQPETMETIDRKVSYVTLVVSDVPLTIRFTRRE